LSFSVFNEPKTLKTDLKPAGRARYARIA